ncbi:LysM peptidoglycan-binding domain-containing protein [Maribacter sp. TH_r10]|uniref:LysM peptidoglycan-binding domain-containing protein n=1 Tax=Maribacter sp. TH_r10 TaxID=3082086 RepID=UPI0029555D1A|nr:LysM peptidoglycan-binding domain-containing protein [Maribacter sp. TH_r10]MDV7137603.1 LysM peptidoglycan-binding domain-containing protein [Maribacter sp. TH_r10]
MHLYKFGRLSFILVLFANISVFAQEVKEVQKEHIKVIKAKDIPLDTLALDMQGIEKMDELESSSDLNDNSLPIVTIGDKKTYDLKDLKIASTYDSLWMKELYENAALYDEMYETVLEIDTAEVVDNTLNTDTLKLRLQRLNQKTPFNVAYNPSLEKVINSFLVRKRGLIERMLTVSQFYFPMFEEQLDKYDIPLEMKYLAIVESALNPRARSRVGATGLWQFMYGTGKMYKLDVSSYVDERRDPIKSTEAACKYLSKLYGIFEDWDLALAAYNSGPGNVNKAIRRSGGYKNYWNIRRNLPRETAGYVPAFLATMYLLEYADEHGLKGKKVDRTYFETDTVHIKSLISFDQISELVGIGVEELKVLNPAYKLDIIPHVEGKEYTLRLPITEMGKFVANEEAIYAHVKEQFKSKESPLPQLVKTDDRIRYKVRSGDYLGKIAARYGVGVSQIKRWNGLRSNNLRIGQRLTIFTRNPVSASKTASKSPQTVASTTNLPASKIHTVKSGDSLWTISRKYPGISIENLREWNGISGNNLKPGTKLKLCNCSS